MLSKNEEDRMRKNTRSLLTVSATLLSLTITLILYFYSTSVPIPTRLSLLAFSLIITLEVAFFAVNVEPWHVETFYNFTKLLFFIALVVMFFGSFDRSEMLNFNGVVNCAISSVDAGHTHFLAYLIFIFFFVLYVFRSQLADAFKEKFWYKILLIFAVAFLLFYLLKASDVFGCLGSVASQCHPNWLEQGETDSLEMCRTTCYDKYKVSAYEIRNSSCFCDVESCTQILV